MTNLTPLAGLDDVVQNETSTLVLGGVGGPMNTQAQQLLNRTEFLNNARVALSDAADPAKGAAVIGRAGQVVGSIAALRDLLKTSVSTHAFVTGYYAAGDGGGGPYYLDAADVVSADNGGTIIVATDGGRWKLIYSESVDILQFGAKRELFDAATITLNNTVFATARAWLGALPIKTKLTFAAGTYGYSLSPNWGIQNATVEAIGEVHLRYSGAGDAWIIDGDGLPNAGGYNNRVYGFTIDAPTTAQNGVFVNKMHHGTYKFKVRGAGANFAGIKVAGCVVSRFDDLEVSPNADGGWYTGATPRYGLWLTGGVGTQTSYCTFLNVIMEGLAQPSVGVGILADGSFGNCFISGTSEGCTTGIAMGTVAQGCRDNKFFGIDLEANIDLDLYDQGAGNEYHSVNSTLKVQILSTARRPQFFGGRYLNFEISLGAIGAGLFGVIFNRDDVVASGTFNNGDPSTCTANCTDEKTATRGPFTQANITVGASPFSHTNNTGNAKWVSITGGTVTALSITRGGVSNPISATAGQIILAPGDMLTTTYSVAPTIYSYSL